MGHEDINLFGTHRCVLVEPRGSDVSCGAEILRFCNSDPTLFGRRARSSFFFLGVILLPRRLASAGAALFCHSIVIKCTYSPLFLLPVLPPKPRPVVTMRTYGSVAALGAHMKIEPTQTRQFPHPTHIIKHQVPSSSRQIGLQHSTFSPVR